MKSKSHILVIIFVSFSCLLAACFNPLYENDTTISIRIGQGYTGRVVAAPNGLRYMMTLSGPNDQKIAFFLFFGNCEGITGTKNVSITHSIPGMRNLSMELLGGRVGEYPVFDFYGTCPECGKKHVPNAVTIAATREVQDD